MKNRILRLATTIRRLSPTEAGVWVEADVDLVTPATELRGRLVGPRCPGTATIEIAYPFRPLPGAASSSGKTLTVQVLIPEPNLWTEMTPFVYEGVLELWQDGQRSDTASLTVGLKLGRQAGLTP